MKILYVTVESTDGTMTWERNYRPEHIIHACADFHESEAQGDTAKMFLTYEMKYSMGDDGLPYYARIVPAAQASVMSAILRDYNSPHSFRDFLNYAIPKDVFEDEFGL